MKIVTHWIVAKFVKSIQQSGSVLNRLNMFPCKKIICKLDHLFLKG